MKVKITENGEEKEIEVFTPEEVDTKINEVKQEYDTKIKEKDDSLTNLTKEKEDLEKKLGDTKEDNPNFKILKEALDKKDAEIKKIGDELSADKKNRKDSFIKNLISKYSKGDEEFEKKVKLHIDETLKAMPDSTDDELTKKIESAVKLASDNEHPGIFDGGIGGGGSSDFGGGGNNVEFTAREKSLGSKMGISEDDYKKYGPKLKNKI